MSSVENTCLVRKHAEMRMAEAKQQQLGCKGRAVPPCTSLGRVHGQRSTINPAVGQSSRKSKAFQPSQGQQPSYQSHAFI